MPTTQDIVQKLWNLCHVLRDDGITYHEYVTELTYLLFLKMTIAAICLGGLAAKAKSLVRLALAQNYSKIRSVSKGGVQPNLNLEKVRALAIPLCPTEEAPIVELAVGAALSRISAVHGTINAQTTALGMFDRAALTKAFRGELVSQDPSDEAAEAMLARVRGTSGAATNGVSDTNPRKRRATSKTGARS
jgi:hypothetical protein